MAFTIYRSTDASAPVLNGVAGSLITVLQACLVDGYTGKAAAGWTIPLTGTNIAVFRPNSGVRHYFRIADDGSVPTAGAREAYIRGYGSKNNATDTPDVNNADPFPTVAQVPLGQLIRKSSVLDSSARDWIIFADARTVHIFIFTGDQAGVASQISFGEFYSLMGSGDSWRSHLHARTIANNTGVSSSTDSAYSGVGAQYGYSARPYTAASGAQIASLCLINNTTNAGAAGPMSSGIFPNPVDGSFYFGPACIWDGGFGTSAIRGRARGIWWPMYVAGTISGGDTISGAGATAGKTWYTIRVGTGTVMVETSDTLDTN